MSTTEILLFAAIITAQAISLFRSWTMINTINGLHARITHLEEIAITLIAQPTDLEARLRRIEVEHDQFFSPTRRESIESRLAMLEWRDPQR